MSVEPPACECAPSRGQFRRHWLRAPSYAAVAAALSFGCAEAHLVGGDDELWPSFGDGSPSDGGPSPGGPNGSGSGTGGSGNVVTGGTGSSTGADGKAPLNCADDAVYVGRAPLRRLTRFEYNKSVEALLDDTSSPGNSLPPELQGNGFGNDADQQPISSFLAEQYGIIAEAAAAKAMKNDELLKRYAPCITTAQSGDEASCGRTFLENFARKAYRRPLEAGELDSLMALYEAVRTNYNFRDSLAAVVEAILQTPDFLYRVEFGKTDDKGRRRPTGYEMASRLSYFFWGAPPDEELEQAANDGSLEDPSKVLSQAQRLLDDERARPVILFFFSRFLPIEGLTDLARDPEKYPTFTPQIGALMRKETETFLEYEIFEGSGNWKSILTAPYSFMNGTLAAYYGIPGVTGDEFRKVETDPTQRLGLLTQGSILTGTTVSNFTNPVRRGTFLLRNMMCEELPEPPASVAASIVPPNPESAKTGRQRYAAHSEIGVCAECHQVMDPPGFALENFDAVGLWRDQENGEPIDASGELELFPEPFSGPLELVQLIAESPRTHACFAEKWLTFASGRSLSEEDACLAQKLEHKFVESGYNVKQLLLEITQTDAFLSLPPKEAQ